ncbi:predicted protein [Nematostella vectensis]|uniref:G-protein coupled receptors family 1 profile domain-containing protein n=1 Tax=Nematostella vectensis TaxID=45351 RepID=A7SB28_NEMVE|nr:predicted protein [Nematostella vectensis]|eukprot:XP_001631168.1 predicted protein [Nematostella vectensis]
MCSSNTLLRYSSEDSLSAVMVSEGVIILIANALTLATFACNRRMVRRSAYCLLCVATADGLVGLSAILLYTANLACIIDGPYIVFCKFLWQVFQSASLSGLVLVAVERMYATLWAIRHRNTRKRWYLNGIALTWLLSIIMGILYVTCNDNDEVSRWTKTIFTLIGLIVLSIAYVAIFIKVKKQHHQHSQQQKGRESFKRERELARTLSIVTVLSLLTWIPDSIYHLLPGYKSNSSLHQSLQVLRLLNSFVNPAVYFLFLKDFRKALERAVKRCFCCRANDIAP